MSHRSARPSCPEPVRFRRTLPFVLLSAVTAAACAPTGDAWPEGTSGAERSPVSLFSPLDEADGLVPEGKGLAPDADAPALHRLDPDLLAAVREAAAAAEDQGIEVVVTGGWRAERYQASLWEDAVRTYGGEEEAGRWVATPEESAHVRGEAVDVGYTDAAYWFARHGSEFGLCQTFANEIWHYELTVEPGDTCPEPVADASER
ncbi:M15 family metallopeptidase [Nocardiopsis sp. MG754419]|uniref:M15 family metallopeptidase n=1 Tax=Nocardiopsis sp. MG754419 TaxID=2259865 RepID=UPI001BA89311|nr:M15 family metallopeptidase [Nocardiopsis sp. MG754419]MBR8742048.1 D-alanyl-D-alanine carboxypeptidase [Nocardiopsis sp. MG754419]